MTNRVDEILTRLAGAGHRGGAFSSEVLIAISKVLPDRETVSLETGCGKSTIMFSNLSSQHFVFAYDDRNQPDSSVLMVQADPAFRSETTTWVYGPTQQTLPTYRFPDGLLFDVILIDGPHGYPFPDLEYALLYSRLKTDGILIIDDVHIPSIGNMYDLLREDRMYEDVGVFATTALLRRTAIKGVPPDGDHWFEQNYNVSRFPRSMERYRPDLRVKSGTTLELRDPATVARYALKALEPAPDGKGARTIDIAATLGFDLGPGKNRSAVVEMTYRSLYPDAAASARIESAGWSAPLPFHKEPATERFVLALPDDGRLKLDVIHPDALPEHDRGVARYDFRRLGSLVMRLRLTVDPGREPARTSAAVQAATGGDAERLHDVEAPASGIEQPLCSAGEFRAVLIEYAAHFPYADAAGDAEGRRETTGVANGLLPSKRNWHIAELLPFEGADFADALTRALLGRPATVQERHRAELERSAPARIAFALEIDRDSRRTGSPNRLYGLDRERFLWRTSRFFRRNRLGAAANLAASFLRKSARRRVAALLIDTSQRQMILKVLSVLGNVENRIDDL